MKKLLLALLLFGGQDWAAATSFVDGQTLTASQLNSAFASKTDNAVPSHPISFNSVGTSSTLLVPLSGTLSTLAGTEALTNKSINGISGLLLGNGSSAVSAYTGVTCTNQFLRVLAADGTGTCAAVSLSTSVSGTLLAAQFPALTGDITTSAASLATTLATVNSNVGSFGDGTHVGAFTVNGKGLITAASSVTITGAAPTGSAGGDLSSTFPNPTVSKINGVSLGTTTATSGNLLIGSGSAWVTNAMTGDATISSTGALTFATVASAATNTKVTYNVKGLVTSGTSATLASSDFANQGTTTTVLHGNASGNPSWAAIGLTTDVTGTLPVANGGTGQTALSALTANPSASLGLSAVNGSASTFMRSDGAPALSQTIVPTWTGVHTYTPTQASNTSVDGLVLANPTAATSGNQSFSSRIRLTGQGWKSNATTASRQVDWIIENQPTQIAAGAARSNLNLSFQSNGGGYTSLFSFRSNGYLGLRYATPEDFSDNSGYSLIAGNGTQSEGITIYTGAANQGAINFAKGTTTTDQYRGYILYSQSSDTLSFGTAAATVATMDATKLAITGTITASAVVSSAAAQTGYLCYNTSGGVITYDGAATCLISLEEYKNNLGYIKSKEALKEVMLLKPFWGTYKKDTPMSDKREQPFLGAHQVESVDPRLAAYTEAGDLHGVRYQNMTAVLISAIQEQQKQIEELKQELKQLKH